MRYLHLPYFTALFLSLLLVAGPVLAAPSPRPENVRRPSERVFALPKAADGAEIMPLGTVIDPITQQSVEGYAFIHYKRGFNHRPEHTNGAARITQRAPKCYAFLSKGAKWKTVEPWVINPANSADLDEGAVFNVVSGGITKWEQAASTNILGEGSTTTATLTAETGGSPDGVNEVYFADISEPDVIAVTIVWGIFYGQVSTRQLVEWDQVYDDVDFDWSLTGEANMMDLDNIVTHEHGHSVGLGHPEDSCTEETMFRFADFGETKKQTLEAGDIAGINQLY